MSELTTEERKWLEKLQRHLNRCPSKRLGFYTVGDPTISVYDTSKDDEITEISSVGNGEFCNAVDEADAHLYTIKFPNSVHSTSG